MRIEQPNTRQLLSGSGAPQAGSGLEPLNGTNDPWRWNPAEFYTQWVSNPVDVSWEAGAEIPSFAAPAAGTLALVLGTTGTNPIDLADGSVEHPFGSPGTSIVAADGVVVSRDPSEVATAAEGGTGTAFLIWSLFNETAITDSPYTATRDDVLPAETRTVADILGPDFTIVDSYEWSEAEVGTAGDFYIDEDSTTVDLWGPRNTVGWGPFPLASLAPVLTSPDGTLHRLIVGNDGTLSTEPA